jgi:hypothetical protein
MAPLRRFVATGVFLAIRPLEVLVIIQPASYLMMVIWVNVAEGGGEFALEYV